jgi:DNA-binding protein H-NS
MPKIDLNAMSRKDLLQYRKDIDIAIIAATDREMRNALAAAEAAAHGHGFTLADLMMLKPTKGKLVQTARPVKFRNTDNLTETWTGRGRRPEWLKKALEDGQKIEDFAIRKAA